MNINAIYRYVVASIAYDSYLTQTRSSLQQATGNKIFKYFIVCKGMHGNINMTFPRNVGRTGRRDMGRIRPGGIRKAGEERAVGRVLKHRNAG